MNITINENAATDDAMQIDSIVESMAASLEELNEKIKKYIPALLETKWAEDLRTNWEQYYSEDIPNTMEEMKQSAANLRLAVENAIAYSREQ